MFGAYSPGRQATREPAGSRHPVSNATIAACADSTNAPPAAPLPPAQPADHRPALLQQVVGSGLGDVTAQLRLVPGVVGGGLQGPVALPAGGGAVAGPAPPVGGGPCARLRRGPRAAEGCRSRRAR